MPVTSPLSNDTDALHQVAGGWLYKWRLLADVAGVLADMINRVFIAPLMLLYVIAVLSGWVHLKPFEAIAQAITEHQVTMVRHDVSTTETFGRIAEILDRTERRNRIMECASLLDRELRTRCLDVVSPPGWRPPTP